MKKYLLAAEQIEAMIEERGGHGKLPTENALCAMLGISRVTLRRAMAILEDAGEIRRVQGSGAYLTGIVKGVEHPRAAFLFPSLTAVKGQERVRIFRHTFSPHGYEAVFSSHENEPEKEREILMGLLSSPPQFLFASPAEPGKTSCAPEYRALLKAGCPVVFLGTACRNLPSLPGLVPDLSDGTCQLCGKLWQEEHRRILLVLEDGPFREDILYGFRSFQMEQGLSLSSESCLLLPRGALLTPGEQAQILKDRLLPALSSASAFLFSDSRTALAAAAILAAQGIRIPGDLSLACVGEQTRRLATGFDLARIFVPDTALADACLSLFAAKMAGQEGFLPALPWTYHEGNTLTVPPVRSVPAV